MDRIECMCEKKKVTVIIQHTKYIINDIGQQGSEVFRSNLDTLSGDLKKREKCAFPDTAN